MTENTNTENEGTGGPSALSAGLGCPMDEVRAKLKERGYAGLVLPGECGCMLDDLAPCGECEREEGEEYINGCEGGYVFYDPTSPTVWMMRTINQEPTPEQWDEIDRAM